MRLNAEELKAHVKDYVERETGDAILSIVFERSVSFLGDEDVIFSVVTAGGCESDWWVIGGSSLTNLYPKSTFPSPDMAFTFHIGVMMRLHEREPAIYDAPRDEIGYDAFICHASDDKETIARPLAESLKSMGFWIWYDEFTLDVGDSLRQSIDRGLATSRYGIVILSKAFFAKNWPQYELNGLTAREMSGTKVILPIWHCVTKADVLAYSPPLADKVALSTDGQAIDDVARALRRVLAQQNDAP
jgi:hypothetical protein